ncbi:15548_t:CDS:2 [Acaulospora morrowiae]|uniref:15548_t:CDS:1 n=1 Tax=Acaulospora morrowiae TaxID=94023 RepID=A0A9N8W1Q8_9GLOM|nr:15548_t:CDS:2 [Acaulospora morrowiae]
MSKEEISKKIARYESFLHDKLEVDLKKTWDLREKLYEEISDFIKLKNHIELIKSNELKELKTMVDIGSNFYVQAKVPDTTYIYVNVGFEFHVQLTLDEAIAFIEKKEIALHKKSDKYTQDIAKISAHIKLVYGALTDILNLQKGEEVELRDDLFL